MLARSRLAVFHVLGRKRRRWPSSLNRTTTTWISTLSGRALKSLLNIYVSVTLPTRLRSSGRFFFGLNSAPVRGRRDTRSRNVIALVFTQRGSPDSPRRNGIAQRVAPAGIPSPPRCYVSMILVPLATAMPARNKRHYVDFSTTWSHRPLVGCNQSLVLHVLQRTNG